ncbi:mannonate dehydratase [Thermoplasma sp.]|uniref:mannonate dehydratase n=1 Tax=Thermoplasma sp. TaxID=1973142 RepID=UPI0012724220|nr:mannonate dehydratase [Thermoplasma sp.]KAA8922180.1 MAG: TIM barrel protein [Thermoplasma sp.]
MRLRIAEILLEDRPNDFWRSLKLMGVNEVTGILPRWFADWRNSYEDDPWDYYPLMRYRNMIEDSGFHLTAIEDNPPMQNIIYGTEKRDQEIENVLKMIRNFGRLGIKVWCYNWMAGSGWSRTNTHIPSDNGSYVTGFDSSFIGDDLPKMGRIDSASLWKNLKYFLDEVIPVAEENDVRLAMHPDDPPIPRFRGIDRIMNSIDAYQHLIDLNRSEYNGITLCQGNFTLMTDDLPSVIRHLHDRIYFVHFRDVSGSREKFVETLIGRGKTDMAACMKAYIDTGYSWIMRVDHSPTFPGDHEIIPGYSYAGRIYSIGYIQGLFDSISRGP